MGDGAGEPDSGGAIRTVAPAILVLALTIVLVTGADMLGVPRPASLAALVAAIAGLACWLASLPSTNSAASPRQHGLAVAILHLPLAALLGIFGVLYSAGIDGLVFVLGLGGGLVLAAVLLAAPLRRSCAASLADAIGLRYGGVWAGRLAVVVLVLAGLLIAAAELTAIGQVGARLAGVPFELAVAAATVGAVGLAWLGRAGNLARLLPLLYGLLAVAVLAPLAMATIRGGLPLLHLGYGSALEEIATLEQGLVRRALAEARSLKPHLTPFLSTDFLNQLGIALGLMLGAAALPHVAGRALIAATPGAARRSTIWALTAVVLIAAALPGLAAFVKLEVLQTIARGTRLDALPAWLIDWGRLGVVRICGVAAGDPDAVAAACRRIARHPGLLRLQDIAIDTELLLLALPRIPGLAFALSAVLAAGLTAAALATLPAVLLAIAGPPGRPALADRAAALAPLAGLALAAVAAASIALARPADMLTLLIWGSTVAAAGLFPALWLGIWWRRANHAGAIAGMAVGLGVALLYIVGTRYFAQSFHGLFASFTEVPLAAERRLADLQRALANAAPGPARETAAIALDAHVQRIAGWAGVRNTAAALFAVPAGIVALVLVSLATRAPDSELTSRLDRWRRPPGR